MLYYTVLKAASFAADFCARAWRQATRQFSHQFFLPLFCWEFVAKKIGGKIGGKIGAAIGGPKKVSPWAPWATLWAPQGWGRGGPQSPGPGGGLGRGEIGYASQ